MSAVPHPAASILAAKTCHVCLGELAAWGVCVRCLEKRDRAYAADLDRQAERAIEIIRTWKQVTAGPGDSHDKQMQWRTDRRWLVEHGYQRSVEGIEERWQRDRDGTGRKRA